MPKDRLADLKAFQEPEEFASIELHDLGAGDNSDRIADFYKDVQEIINSIERLSENVENVKKHHTTIISTPKPEEKVKRALEQDESSIKTDANKIKLALKKIAQQTEEIGRKDSYSAEHRIRTTQHQMLTSKFIEVVTDYQSTQADFRDKCKRNIQRQLEITGRHTTDDEIEEMIEAGNPAIFTHGIITETQQARQTVAEIEARHSDIMKLEKSIRELRDLFIDLATLVEAQGEMVDRIENHVSLSKSHVDKARTEVNQAIAYRSKARIKKIICFTILILFIVAIVLISIYA